MAGDLLRWRGLMDLEADAVEKGEELSLEVYVFTGQNRQATHVLSSPKNSVVVAGEGAHWGESGRKTDPPTGVHPRFPHEQQSSNISP